MVKAHKRARRAVGFTLVAVGSIAAVATIIAACSSSDDDTGTPTPSSEASTSDHATSPMDASIADTSIADVDAADAMLCLGATDAASLDDATVQAGHDLVIAFHCAGCHQAAPADAGLSLNGGNSFLDGAVFSANLTPDPVNGIGCWTDPQIENAILDGVDDMDASLCVMPLFGAKVDGGDPRMDAGAAAAITTFLRTLKSDPNAVKESKCPAPDAGP